MAFQERWRTLEEVASIRGGPSRYPRSAQQRHLHCLWTDSDSILAYDCRGIGRRRRRVFRQCRLAPFRSSRRSTDNGETEERDARHYVGSAALFLSQHPSSQRFRTCGAFFRPLRGRRAAYRACTRVVPHVLYSSTTFWRPCSTELLCEATKVIYAHRTPAERQSINSNYVP